MQPSPLPRRTASPARRTLLASALLLLGASLFAAPASALYWATAPPAAAEFRFYTYYYYTYSYDPQTGELTAQMCIGHDSEWKIDADTDDDGNTAVWVPAGPDESDGSRKASTACIDAPPDLDLPGAFEGMGLPLPGDIIGIIWGDEGSA